MRLNHPSPNKCERNISWGKVRGLLGIWPVSRLFILVISALLWIGTQGLGLCPKYQNAFGFDILQSSNHAKKNTHGKKLTLEINKTRSILPLHIFMCINRKQDWKRNIVIQIRTLTQRDGYICLSLQWVHQISGILNALELTSQWVCNSNCKICWTLNYQNIPYSNVYKGCLPFPWKKCKHDCSL